jgi:CubicO group peptidase (beta-lactamase class C family)
LLDAGLLFEELRATFATERDYLLYPRYPRERLFGPLSMKSAILAPDASGTFAASSFLYATARDFARLGLLFLQDGMWEGKALFPDSWVVYSRGPARALTDGSYGAHLWLRLPESMGLGVPPCQRTHIIFSATTNRWSQLSLRAIWLSYGLV